MFRQIKQEHNTYKHSIENYKLAKRLQMINPINFRIIDNQYINKQNLQNSGLNPSFDNTNNVELSNYKVGQAILNGNKISFRNLTTPIEITDKYNKRIESKDHLDLPNIHVYEYPDTNLKVLLNLSSKLDYPLVRMEIYPNNDNLSPINAKLIELMLNNRFKQKHDESNYAISNEEILDFTLYNNKNAINNVYDMNKLAFSSDFTEEELINAKKALLQYFDSEQYKSKNVDLDYLYGNKLLSKDDFTQRVSQISLSDINKYQKEYLQNSSATLYLFMREQNFENNKNNIFKILNSNVPMQLKKQDEINESFSQFIPNTQTIIIRDLPDNKSLNFNYKIQLGNTKTSIIYEMLQYIINNEQFVISQDYYNNPLNIKNPEDINTCLYCKVSVNPKYLESIDTNSNLVDFDNYIKSLYNSDLSEDLVITKKLFKSNAIYDFIYNQDSIDRYLSTSTQDDKDIFQIYEIIDSLSQDDLKNFIKKYLIEQQPIVHTGKENEENKGI